MSGAEFDRHAASYREVHAANIAASGEEPEYFAAYKMRDFAAIAAATGRPADGQFLDFGCGIGNAVAPFRALLPRARLIAADPSRESLAQLAATHGAAVRTLALDGAALPLPAASLDGAFACCVFHHIPPEGHAAALRELRRVLRPGAPLMVYEHNPLNPLTVRAVRDCPLDENAILIRAGTMRRRLLDAGFGSARIAYRVFFPAALKALRPLESTLRWLPLGAQYHATALA